MINVLIQMRATAPDAFADPVRQQQIIDAIEALVQAEGFDDTDTTFNGTGGTIVPAGTVLFQLEQGCVQAHENEISIIADVNDPSGLRLASSSAEGSLGHLSGNAIRVIDRRQEMVGMILFERWEAMRHLGADNLHGAIAFLVRDPRRSTNDDAQFVRAVTIAPDGFHIHVPIFIHGQQVHS